jgi:hypothetical protein
LYERGWRQNFNRSGFPGPDEEVCLSWLLVWFKCTHICKMLHEGDSERKSCSGSNFICIGLWNLLMILENKSIL